MSHLLAISQGKLGRGGGQNRPATPPDSQLLLLVLVTGQRHARHIHACTVHPCDKNHRVLITLDALQTRKPPDHPSGEVPPGDAVDFRVADDQTIHVLTVDDVDAQPSDSALTQGAHRRVAQFHSRRAGECTEHSEASLTRQCLLTDKGDVYRPRVTF